MQESFEAKTVEQKLEDWPSDYYEATRPIFTMSLREADGRSIDWRLKYRESQDEKCLVVYLLLAGRECLARMFGFRELTLSEIRSLVEISKNLVREFKENINSETEEPLNPSIEVVSHWLSDNYGIDWTWERIESLKERKNNDGRNTEKKYEDFDNRHNTFADYVRKVRDKALLLEPLEKKGNYE